MAPAMVMTGALVLCSAVAAAAPASTTGQAPAVAPAASPGGAAAATATSPRVGTSDKGAEKPVEKSAEKAVEKTAETAPRTVVEISGATFRPIPLAIAPCHATTDAARDGCQLYQSTLRNDLELSGLFALDHGASGDNDHQVLDVRKVPFDKWNALGVDGLVRAVASSDGRGSTRLELRLFLVPTSKQAIAMTVNGTGEGLRRQVHEFANRIYTQFTGAEGPFLTRITFVRRVADGKELFACDLDGHNLVSLTANGKLNLLPAWSASGRSIVFTSYLTGRPMLHVLDVASRNTRVLSPAGQLQTGGAYSPDGNLIAFSMSESGSSNIYVVPSVGGTPRNITHRRELEGSPTWSPDGKQIAFVSRRSGEPQIYMMGADGSNPVRLTREGNFNQTPDWSPRGDLVAYTGRDAQSTFDIWTVDVNTGEERKLTHGEGRHEEPTFSPNGRHIIYASTRGGRSQLWIMGADGSNPRPLGVMDAGTPDWGPGTGH